MRVTLQKSRQADIEEKTFFGCKGREEKQKKYCPQMNANGRK